MFNINGEGWKLFLTSPIHPMLIRSDGQLTIGACDNETKGIYINGELLENDITDTYIVTAGMTINPVKLGDDEYFCLGDNRNNSEDSRFSSIGMVKRKHIIGKTWMVLSPFEDIKFIK